MAEGGGDLLTLSVQKLDEELTCPVCQEHFKEPKVLPCLHYYCKKCVANLISRARGRAFNCPECRREVRAANNDPESFPTAFFVNRMEEVYSVMKKAEAKENVKCESCSEQPSVAFCQQCHEYICKDCVRAHRKMRHLSNHVVVSIDSLRTGMTKKEGNMLPVVAQELKCSKHKNEALKLYCHTCYKLVCRDCILIDHSGHKYAFVVDVAPKCKSAIKEKATSLQNVSSNLKSALASLADSKKKLLDHGTATMKAIHDTHDKVASKLQKKSKELKEETTKRIDRSTEEITTQEKNAQLAMGEVESVLEFLHRTLEKATDQELLSLQKQMFDQANRMSQLYAKPAAKFPVPRLPQLEVQCSEDILQVLQDEFTVHDKAITKTAQWKDVAQELTSQLRRKEAAISKLIGEKKSLEKELKRLMYQVNDFEHGMIAMLSHYQEGVLREEARRLQLVIDIDRALKCIQLKGSRESISEMKVKIIEILSSLEKEDNRQRQAERMVKVVQWKRKDSSETPYDTLTNLEIEEAYRAGNPTYVFRHPQSAESFTIDFQKMEEIDHTIHNQRCRVKRVAEGAESDRGFPDDWEPMIDPRSGKEVALRVIDLSPTSKGYQFALAEFHKTMPQGNYNTIVKIQRIQNPALYGQYIAKKKQMDTHNPSGVQNERWLFHGTTSRAVPQINQTSFNRSFRGQNGTAYGQGTYFARDASYSNQYALADAYGLKHMYLVRVLTGEFTRGTNSMIVAPPKDPKDTTVLFDSVVDNTYNPSIYVVFYDGDAYPEYLIVYR